MTRTSWRSFIDTAAPIPRTRAAKNGSPNTRASGSAPSVAPSIGDRGKPVVLDDTAIPSSAVLRDPPLRGVVHVHQAEAGHVALGPFEVVEQGPDEIPAQVDACLDRQVGGGE